MTHKWMAERLLLICVALSCSSPSLADGIVKGTVQYLRLFDATVHPSWSPPRFWFSLNGVSSAGSCYTWFSNVPFVSEGKEALAMIMRSEMTGREIQVTFSDSQTFGGLCRAQYLTIGSPLPTP